MNNTKENLTKLPKPAIDFLLSDYGKYLNLTIKKEHKISGLNMSFLAAVVEKLFLGEIKFVDLPTYLINKLNISEAKARELALDILGKRLLVVKNYLPGQDVMAVMRSMGGKPESYEHYAKIAEKMPEKEKIALILDVDIDFSNPESEYEKKKLAIDMEKIRQVILVGTDEQKRGLLNLINENSKWLTPETQEKLQNPNSALGKAVRNSLAAK